MKTILILVLAAGLAAPAAAWPGISGGRGLFRVQDARSEGNWTGSLALHGLGRSASYHAIFEAWRVGMTPEMDIYTNDLTGAVALSPSRWFELFFWHGGTREYTSKHPDSSLVELAWLKGYQPFWDWHNLVPGAKISVPVLPVAKFGVSGAWSLPRNDDVFRRSGWRWGSFGLHYLNGPILTGLATFEFRELAPWTPTLHLNYGRAWDSFTPQGESEIKTTWTNIGGALQYSIDKLDLFAEFVSEQRDGAGPFDEHGRVFVTPGFRVGYLRPFYLSGGLSIGLSDSTPDYELVIGMGLSGRIFTPRKPTTGIIAGRVVDAATGAGLTALVSFPGEEEPEPLAAEQGGFRARGVRPGSITVNASAAGYLPAEAQVEVVAGKTAQVELRLRPRPTAGGIAGLITDAATGAPIEARVEFPGSELSGVDAGRTGFELADVPAAEYKVEVSAEGFLTASATVTVLPEEQARADFALVRRDVTIPLKVHFDFDQATLKPESRPALEGAAKIMRENPGIRVEIQGHTDNVGAADYNRRLSQRRAQAVVEYLVTNLGIERARLQARGFGPDQPIASNDTEEGQTLNRRAEFIVLD